MTVDLLDAAAPSADTDVSEPPSRRYYAHLCPPYPFEPTTDTVRVVCVGDGIGEGLQSCRDFHAGEIVFRFFGAEVSSQSLYTLQIAPGRYLSDPLVMGKVLHACDPNMSCDMSTLTFTARRAIKAGEFLTMDYESTEDELFRSFDCACDAAQCRGRIRGRKFR